MKKFIRSCLCMLALLLAIMQPLTASAATVLDPTAPCSLTLHYTKDGTAFGGLEIKLFRVAAFEADGSYALTGPFAEYPVRIHDIQSQREWQESTQALVSYAEADGLTPTATGTTDANGTVKFEDLVTGLYLIMGVRVQTPTERFQFQPFVAFLATPNSDGTYTYDVEAYPKAGTVTPITQFRVIKLWNDTGSRQERPNSISVDILKNGVLHETVTLSQENNWAYTWASTDLDAQWSVAEREVPAGYTVSVSFQNGAFTITNECPPDPSLPPKTGDSTTLWPYIASLIASGVGLVLLGSLRKRKKS